MNKSIKSYFLCKIVLFWRRVANYRSHLQITFAHAIARHSTAHWLLLINFFPLRPRQIYISAQTRKLFMNSNKFLESTGND